MDGLRLGAGGVEGRVVEGSRADVAQVLSTVVGRGGQVWCYHLLHVPSLALDFYTLSPAHTQHDIAGTCPQHLLP